MNMPKAAKTVSVVKPAANCADAVSATTINSIALVFIHEYKKSGGTHPGKP
jgi:hypothetical protein